MTDFENMTDKELRTFKSGKWHEIQASRREMAAAEVFLQRLRAAADPASLKALGVAAWLAGDYEKAEALREQLLALETELAAASDVADDTEPVSTTVEGVLATGDSAAVAPGDTPE